MHPPRRLRGDGAPSGCFDGEVDGLGADRVAEADVAVGEDVVQAANGGGGNTISAAPELPLGQPVTGGGTMDPCAHKTYEFWRVTMGVADRLIVDFGSTGDTTTSGGVDVSLYDPTVTDYTYDQAQPITEAGTTGKHELVFKAPTAGRWAIGLGPYEWCEDHTVWGYSLTAYVQKVTSITLDAPTLIPTSTATLVNGRLTNVTTGAVRVQITGPRGFAPLGSVVAVSAGAFHVRFTARAAGTYHIKARYQGDRGHQPSARSATLRAG